MIEACQAELAVGRCEAVRTGEDLRLEILTV